VNQKTCSTGIVKPVFQISVRRMLVAVAIIAIGGAMMNKYFKMCLSIRYLENNGYRIVYDEWSGWYARGWLEHLLPEPAVKAVVEIHAPDVGSQPIDLSCISSFSRLQALSVANVGDSDLTFLDSLPNLQSLKICDARLDASDIKAILSSWQLTELTLMLCVIEEPLDLSWGQGNTVSLKKLSFAACSGELGIIETLSQFPELRELDFLYTQWTSVHTQRFPAMPQLQKLRIVCWGDYRYRLPDAVKKILEQKCPNVKVEPF